MIKAWLIEDDSQVRLLPLQLWNCQVTKREIKFHLNLRTFTPKQSVLFCDIISFSRLYAMRCEMVEDYENALEFYESILADDDSNSQARKRKIAIYKAQKETTKAIQELNKYLKE